MDATTPDSDQQTPPSAHRDAPQSALPQISSDGARTLLDSLLSSIQDAVITMDLSLRITSWNHAAEQLYGWSAAEALGRQAGELLRSDYLGHERQELVQQLTEQGVWKGELRHAHRDGRVLHISASTGLLRDPDGAAAGFLTVNRDISALRAAQAQLEGHARHLELLAESSRAFAESGRDYQALLDRVARVIAETLRAACSIRLLSEDGQWLTVAVTDHFDPAARAAIQAALVPWRIHITESTPVALAVRLGETQFTPVIDRAALREMLPPERRDIVEQSTHSMIVLPLRLHGRSIGSLMVARTATETASFDADDVSLAQDLAERAALALDNAQLLGRLQAELSERLESQRVTELLYQAGQLLARPLGHDEILNTLLDVLQQLIPLDSANIMQPERSGAFRVRYLRGYETWTDPELVRSQIFDTERAPLIGRIVATQRSVLIADTSQEPAWESMLGTQHIGCWMGVPLIANDRLVGIFSIDRHQPHSLTERDVRLAQTLAVSAATAIERAQLLEQLTDERAQLARRVEERTAELSLANAELARAARLKDEFLASMSHELRTPLNSILARSEALQEQIYGPVTPRQATTLQGIEESGLHLLSLINDILDLSKIEAGRLELSYATLELDLLCPLCLRMVSQTALLKRISLSSEYDSQVQTVRADETRLKQILVNLLSNAVKFTPEGGRVGLLVRADPAAQTVTFTVWDTGIGIAPEDLPRLFQPFVQLDTSLSRQHTGTGLGLALVARLARAHGGSVAVASAPGQGSQFSVTLPWSASPPAQPSPRRTASVAPAAPAIRQALVVEDSPVAAAQLARYLHELGAEVEVLSDGAQTVERAAALRPDVILLDILLPGDDGLLVLRHLKDDRRTRGIPVLVVSVVDARQEGEAGAAAWLVKPVDRVTLERALRQVLAREAEPLVQTAIVVAAAGGRPRLLLADDNEANIVSMQDYLLAKGYDVSVARSGGEAVGRAREVRPELVLMDIQMPGMDGLEAIRRLRGDEELRGVPIIAVTALAMAGDRERCLAAGADAYLTKPVNLRGLVELIEALRRDGSRQTGAREPQ